MLQNFLIALAILIGLIGLLALGFFIPPRPFRSHPAPSRLGLARALPDGLPEPVRRHFRETVGESLPEIHTAVVWGRGKACIRGVWLPLRFKVWYRAGQGFYRRIEVTWFQRPVLRGIDYYIGGEGVVEVGGRELRGPRVDQGQLLTMWAESVLMPFALVDPALAHWEPVDEHCARLVFPFGEGNESLLAYFDPETGRMTHLAGQRYAAPTHSSENDAPLAPEEKEPWRVDLLTWREVQNMQIPCQISVAWGEAGSPWSYWTAEGVAYNVNVSDQLGQP
jgi:hypothetical protein